jgi:phosphate/sulfate permease
VTLYVSQHKINEGNYPSLAVLIQDIAKQVEQYGTLAKIPAEAVGNSRNDMYLASEAPRSGLQLSTIRNIVLAWVLTLPMAMMLSAGLYVLFLNLF